MVSGRLAFVMHVCIILGIGAGARAQEPLPAGFDTAISGYCDYITGTTDADSALFLWPHVFAGAGLVTGGSDATGDETATFGTSIRVTAGLRYDFMDLYRGLTDRARTAAECARFRSSEIVSSQLERASAIGLKPALQAQLRILEEAVPVAAGILEQVRGRYARSEVALEELNATEMRVHALNAQFWQTRETLEPLQDSVVPDRVALDRFIASFRAGDEQVEKYEARLRRIRAWDLGIRGGYDQVLGVDRLPVFALVSASFALGGFGQRAANRRAEAGREAWRRHSVLGLEQRVARVIRDLEISRGLERQHLHQTSVLLADLEKRLEAISGIKSEKVKGFADYLWFEVVKNRAEKAYLDAYLAAMDRFLGEPAPLPVAGSGPRDALVLLPVRLKDLDVTHMQGGDVREVEPGLLAIDTAAMRADLGRSAPPDRQTAELDFVYEGPSRKKTALASGVIRTQIGAKLRAANGCNLVYVMWRIEPDEGIVVFVKTNPGKKRSSECGAKGYERVKASSSVKIDPPAPGSKHLLRAELAGQVLTVMVDGDRVWEGTLPESAWGLEGPVGLRVDNGRFLLRLGATMK